MAHYALLDSDNIVIEVFVGKDEDDTTEPDWELYYAADGYLCKRTSYNTRAGVYHDPQSNEIALDQSKAFRKNFAEVGFTYDHERDAFIPPKPFDSWLLDEFSCRWIPPVQKPSDDGYFWSEEKQTWVHIPSRPTINMEILGS